MWYKLIRWLVGRLPLRDKERLVYELVEKETIGPVMAENIITEVVKDQHNKVISFIVRD